MSVTISASVFKEFVTFLENRLELLVSRNEEARLAFIEIKNKAKTIAETFGFQVGETSLDQPPSSPEVIARRQSGIGPRSENDLEVTEETQITPPTDKERKVKKRRRRVSQKISKIVALKTTEENRTVANDHEVSTNDRHVPDFSSNKDLKYLTAELGRQPNNEHRVHVYIEYLRCCRFNCKFNPEAVIKFSEEDAHSLGVWASGDQSSSEVPEVVAKLDCAIEQRFQLASQQVKEIGKLLLGAESVFKLNVGESSRHYGKGRPTLTNIFEVLGNKEHSIISGAALRESTYVAMTMMKFPLLSFVNEPVSHLASGAVRSSVQILADALQESCSVPDNIAMAYLNISPYVLNAAEINLTSLSQPIPLEMLIPNDGDGVIELHVCPQQPGALQNSIYHRLYAVDAPELYCTSSINTDGKVHKRRNGHLSHLAVHYYFNSFVRPQGTSHICKEHPRYGKTPMDRYQRPISSFWFAWFEAPNAAELSLLDEVVASLEGQQECVRSRIMSIFNPRAANSNNPFFVNLNALLVVSGFCHVYTKYSPDASLLKLQQIAKDNHYGSIWSGIKKNFVLGARQEDHSNADEATKSMTGFDHAAAERMGFPLTFQDTAALKIVRFQPWHERECKRVLEQATRSEFREHQHRLTKLPYGFVVDMYAETSLSECKYKTSQTGEAFIQIRPSMVVGIGGVSTGMGLFTLKQIPEATWITSYAPTAPVRLGQDHDQSDFILKTIRNGSEVEIDGNICPLGLGRIIQDGTFPFILAPEKFKTLAKARVNCQWANRDGEIWFKSTRIILAGEELLTRNSHNNSYWKMQFSENKLQSLRQALLTSNDGSLSEGERILRNFSFTL